MSTFTTSSSYSVESSYQKREDMRTEAMDNWRQKPIFGWGTDQFRYHSQYGLYSHSNITELLANNGIVGFLFYHLVFFSLGFKALLLWRKGRKQLDEAGIFEELAFVSVMIILITIWNAAAVTYVDKSYWVVVSVVIGMMGSIYRKGRGLLVASSERPPS